MASKITGIDGVLLLDKGIDVSSNGALQSVRRLFEWAKAGHTGTLDPLATGLLPICFGEATKFAQGLLDAPKRYDAVLKLGFNSDTGDGEGELEAIASPDVDREAVESVLSMCRGSIVQLPPMHSALKRNGRPLYSYARAGVTVERVPRRVEIFALQLVEQLGDELRVSIACSKGTYIRVLAQDIGLLLGCGAYLKRLRRTGTGPFDISSAFTLDALQNMTSMQRLATLTPMDTLVQGVPELHLNDLQVIKLTQGQEIGSDNAPVLGNYRLYGPTGIFLGLGESKNPFRLVARRLIRTNGNNRLKSLETTA